MTSAYSWIGHRCRELLVHADRLTQPNKPGQCVVIFPGESTIGSASDLRATALAGELRRLGWRAIIVPPQLELDQRLRIIRAEQPDIIFLQQSRHPLNRPRYYSDTPCVFDADDADILDPKCRDAVIECCRNSVAIIVGSRFLADEFRPYNNRISIVWTGTYLRGSRQSTPNESRVPSVAWATTDPTGYPYESELVREVIIRLARRTRFTFYQYGVRPDQRDSVEKFLTPIRNCGVPVRVFEPMGYKRFIGSLESVAVGLQPVCMEYPFSRGRSFGKVLAYLAADVAVVASDSVDHPLFFQNRVNGVLAPNQIELWVDGAAFLLEQPSLRAPMVARARADFLARLTTAVAAERVSDVLKDAIRPVKTSS
jgi:Glycosyl transferases group 1